MVKKNDKKDNSFAILGLIGVVAVVAIVGLVLLFTNPSVGSSSDVDFEENLAGQFSLNDINTRVAILAALAAEKVPEYNEAQEATAVGSSDDNSETSSRGACESYCSPNSVNSFIEDLQCTCTYSATDAGVVAPPANCGAVGHGQVQVGGSHSCPGTQACAVSGWTYSDGSQVVRNTARTTDWQTCNNGVLEPYCTDGSAHVASHSCSNADFSCCGGASGFPTGVNLIDDDVILVSDSVKSAKILSLSTKASGYGSNSNLN